MGTSLPKMPVATFADMWDETVHTHGGRPFLVFRGVDEELDEWTYAEFDLAVGRAANVLRSLGVIRGSAVHLCLRNCPAFIALWLAASRLGAFIVPADPGSAARDVGSQISRVDAVVGFASKDRSEAYRSGASLSGIPVVELAENASDLAEGGPLWWSAPSTAEHPRVLPEDRIAVMFTSGTTAQPKGVDLTQANYATVGHVMSAAAGVKPEHRWYVTLPLFHANAQYYCFAAAIAVGASVALTATFSASRWIQWASELEVTHASLFAAPIRMILARTPEGIRPLSLQHVWFAQSLAPAQHQEFTRLVGVAPRQVYGMTETIAVVTWDDAETPSAESIGTVTDGRTVALLDPIDRAPVAEGKPGIIALQGTPGVDLFKGYLNDPETTAKSFHKDETGHEWFLTGDLGMVDREGRWHFVGRVDDVVKVAGENVSLTEVEAALAQIPGVLEVAVLAVPDPIREVVPEAYVVPRAVDDPPSVASLDTWAQSHLVPAARPRAWHFLEELPRTSVGKIRRSAITH